MNRRYILPRKKYRHQIPPKLLPKRGGLRWLHLVLRIRML